MEKKNMTDKMMDVAAWAILLLIGMALVAPALLAFTEGRNGQPTVWNLVGIAYMAFWAWKLNRKAQQR